MGQQDDMQQRIDNHKTISERQTDLILQLRKNLDMAVSKGTILAAAEKVLLAALNDIVKQSQTAIDGAFGGTPVLEAEVIKERASSAVQSYFQIIENLS